MVSTKLKELKARSSDRVPNLLLQRSFPHRSLDAARVKYICSLVIGENIKQRRAFIGKGSPA